MIMFSDSRRWLIRGLFYCLFTLIVSSCHRVSLPPYTTKNSLQLMEDVYLIQIRPYAGSPENALVPVNSGFYERSPICSRGYNYDIFCFPTVEEFRADPSKWRSWRYAYPLSSGMYRIIDVITAGTLCHFPYVELIKQDEQGNHYAYSHAILDSGDFKGSLVSMQYLDDHEDTPEQERCEPLSGAEFEFIPSFF